LRSNAPDRQLYERTKRELARKNWKYTQNYADAKTAVVDEQERNRVNLVIKAKSEQVVR
jgi:GrpB-like predicted nucleotidyltransferase (UPF0157 family)